MTKRIFSVIYCVTLLFAFASPASVWGWGGLFGGNNSNNQGSSVKAVPNYRQDNYQYHGANKGGDCSGAQVGNSFVVGNKSGIVIYYDLTTPGARWIDYRIDIGSTTLWCRFKHDEKNVMDFDYDVDEDGIQMRSHFLQPGKYYYFILEGSQIKLKAKELKRVVVRGKEDWDYDVK